MKATVIHGPRDIRFEEVPDPRIELPTDAIVKVHTSCICGSDLWPYRGDDETTEPHTIGHECLGVVEEVGADVRDVRPGDFVIVPFDHCDNTCSACRNGAHSACENLGMTRSGQAEYARVTQADGSLVKTDGVPDADLVPSLMTLSDVMATGWHAAVSAGVRRGGTAVVVGDGAVGLCGVLAASQLGAETVIAMSRHEPRQELARRFGATHVVAERGKEGVAAVKEILGGVGGDAVLECVGNGPAFEQAFRVARPGATVGMVGVPHGVEAPLRVMFSKNVGLAGGMAPVRRYLPDLLERVLRREIDPGLVFDLTLPLDQVAEGYRAMDERTAIKVLLQP
ncbi:zinc-dependent alcohol dehydrogenase family protein [Nocardioides dongxiaopingii]|uniref:zinc-dependent alcohol dehydrogenase family protein n=1 Tax=Nocardioides sp. S-1144 TaxID=2582905 RepID=UPI00110DC93A|nr:zinc-dependent alcohol dehydrogenase family protein [Nocardioides sp. S-1144]QCW50743.1 zinc-dependent alcohol dehydrogenase family protein [Nocardioides sp. S-1144]